MNHPRVQTALLAVLTVLVLVLVVREFSPTRSGGDAGLTRAEAQAILAELRRIRGGGAQPGAAREARPEAATAKLEVGARLGQGSPTAPLTLVEFSDFDCPYCRRFHETTLPVLRERFVQRGQVRYVLMDLPLRIHPAALTTAQAVHCAGEQGRFYELSDAIFAGGRLSPESIEGAVRAAQVDPDRLQECLRAGRHLDAIQASMATADAVGITGTPGFVLGRTRPDGTLTGRVIVGALPTEVFVDAIEAALKEQ
jgi:protein-disulfide isomerase